MHTTSQELRGTQPDKNNKWSKIIQERDNVTNALIKYTSALSSGNCCWDVKERKKLGHSFSLSNIDSGTNGWPIKKVMLATCSPNVYMASDDPNICKGENCTPPQNVNVDGDNNSTRPVDKPRPDPNSGIKCSGSVYLLIMVIFVYHFDCLFR